ncbi:MAG TPA: hypothetical protein VJB91_01390, partial [Patescibacteria group bacterium]|nr:hypothetical protein [Patescibacteria group bacterium]
MDTLHKIEIGTSHDLTRRDREMMKRSTHAFISKDVPSPDIRSIPWGNLTEAQKIAWSKRLLAGTPPRVDERSPSSINLRSLTNTQRDKALEEAGRSHDEDNFFLPNLLERDKPRVRLEIQAKVQKTNGDEFSIPYIRLKSPHEQRSGYSSSREHREKTGKRIESRGKNKLKSFTQKAAFLVGVPLSIYLASQMAIRVDANHQFISPIATTEQVQEVKQPETQKFTMTETKEEVAINLVKEEKTDTHVTEKKETQSAPPEKPESAATKVDSEHIVIPDSQTGGEKAVPK